MIEEEKEEEEALHPDSHQCEQVLHIGREKKKTAHRVRYGRERTRGPTSASLDNSILSEVSGDGLQGVLSCTMDVHILERGRHQCQSPYEEICVYTCLKIAVVSV